MAKTLLDAINQMQWGTPGGTIFIPDNPNITLADISSAQTFTNKTLTSPTLTLPVLNGPTVNNGSFPNSVILSATSATQLMGTTLAGRQTVLNRAAGITVTLPAALATGNVYTLVVGTALSAATYVINAASGTDYFRGVVFSKDDGTASSVIAWGTANTGTVATESDIVTFDGTTKGGGVGDFIIFSDIAAGVWSVFGFTRSSGTEATPFSVGI